MEPYKRHWRLSSRQARRSGAADCGCGRGAGTRCSADATGEWAPSHYSGTRVWVYAALFLMLLTVAAPLGLAWAQEAPAGAATEYRDIPGLGSRNLIWIIAQQHLLLAGFVLGVPIFAWVCEIVGVRTRDPRYDTLAKEFTKLLTSAYATTALFGGILLFLLIGLYPKLMNYLTDVFFPSFLVYSALFLLETATLYLYWYGWDAMQGRKKGMHLFLGFLLNVFALFIMIVPNSWATFQTSPVVITESSMWAKAWAATWNPTWWPLNVHRLIANVVLGGFLCGAYAGLKYLMAQSTEERVHYDWMGYVGNFIGVFGMLPLPFAGYWLMREVYQYNQQMGITLMGGFLSWLFILQAMLIGILFLGANYYFWLGIMYRIPGAEAKYRKPILVMLIILLMFLGVWMTLHSLVARLEEARKMGRTPHPMLGVPVVMSPRAAYALVLNAVMVILLMTLMGYARSSSRVHWHVYGVMQDTSPYAYSPALGYAAAFMSLNTFLFCLMVAFIFWVASLGGEKKEGTPGKAHVKEAVKPAVAGAPVPAAGRR